MQRSIENTKIIKQTSLVKTVKEAIDVLINLLPLKDRAVIANMAEGELINLDYTLGVYIRNKFDLSPGNNKLLEDCRRETRDKYLHHSQSPMVIITELWKQLRKTHKLRVVK